MQKSNSMLRGWAIALAMLFSVGLASIPAGQNAALAQAHHKSFVQRHAVLSSMAAGAAAYHAAKVTGNNRAMMGGRKNFMQRHPVMTGIGAAMITHHMIKKSMRHQ